MNQDDKNNLQNKKRLGWLFALPLALVVLTHGMIHLMYVTWDGETTGLGFNGESLLPSGTTDAAVMGLMTLTIAAYTFAALGLIRFPAMKNKVPELVIIGSIASLAGFAVMAPGLVPDIVAHAFGPITSAVLMLGAVYRRQVANKAAAVLPKFLAKRMGSVA